QSFIVVWRHVAFPGPDRFLAKRFDFDGRALDPEPLVLASDSQTTSSAVGVPQTPSIAFDGTAFFVAWTEGKKLYTIRVGEDGVLSDAREVEVADVAAYSAHALWTGNEFLIGYAVYSYCATQYCTPGLDLAALRV